MSELSLRAYARHRGVTLRAVQKAIEAGRIRKNDNGKIEAEAADASWHRNTDPARQRKPEPAITPAEPVPPPLLGGDLQAAPRELTKHPDWSDLKLELINCAPPLKDLPAKQDTPGNGSASTSYAESRAVREYWDAVSARAKGLQLLGKLEDAEEIKRHQLARAAALRDALLSWPSRVSATLAAEMGVEERHVNGILDREIRVFLSEQSHIGHTDGNAPSLDNGHGRGGE